MPTSPLIFGSGTGTVTKRLIISVLMVASVLPWLAQPASAYNGCGSYRLIQQEARKVYEGQYANFYTYDVYMPDTTNTFSLSHIYSYVQGDKGRFVGTGYFKGLGNAANNPLRYYTASVDSLHPFHEVDLGYPSVGTYRIYEQNFRGVDPNNGRYIWDVYAGQLSSPDFTWSHVDMNAGVATAGGEQGMYPVPNTEMRVRSTVQQLKDGNNVWHNWTPAYMNSRGDVTTACGDAGFQGYHNAYYTDFYFYGAQQ